MYLAWAALLTFIMTLVVAPWEKVAGVPFGDGQTFVYRDTAYAPVWDALDGRIGQIPGAEVRLRIEVLVMEWVALGIAYMFRITIIKLRTAEARPAQNRSEVPPIRVIWGECGAGPGPIPQPPLLV